VNQKGAHPKAAGAGFLVLPVRPENRSAAYSTSARAGSGCAVASRPDEYGIRVEGCDDDVVVDVELLVGQPLTATVDEHRDAVRDDPLPRVRGAVLDEAQDGGLREPRHRFIRSTPVELGRRLTPRRAALWEDGRMSITITGDPTSDELLTSDPFALLTGMLLDQ